MIQHILCRWMSSDWAIMPEAFEARMVQLKAYLDGKQLPFESALPARPTADLWGNPIPQPRTERGVAIVPVSGALVKNASPVDKLVFGSASYEDLKGDLKAAHQKRLPILMHFDSPGGMVVGCPESADLIANIASERTVMSYTEDMMASAAYYLAAPSNAIFASPSSIVGSIGTIRTVASMSRMLEAMGIDVDLITSGKWKAAGHPAKELTEGERELFQQQVDGYGNDFRTWVSGHRQKIDLDDMEGQTFQGKDAASRGFVDFTASSLDDVLDMIGDPLR